MSEITLKEKTYLVIAIIKVTTVQVLCRVPQMYKNPVIIFVKSKISENSETHVPSKKATLCHEC